MTMASISIQYHAKYKLLISNDLCVTKDGKIFNLKNGRLLKRCINGGQVGYWIGRKFYSLDKLRPFLVKIEKEFVPF